MNVEDGLTGSRPIIGNHSKATAVEQSFPARYVDRQRQRVGNDRSILGADGPQGGNVPARHDEYVGRRLRVEVAKGDRVLALSHERRAELPVDDLAEDAISRTRRFGHWSLPGVVRSATGAGCREVALSMPELPEVETVRRSLLPHVLDRRIVGLRLGDFPGVLGPEPPEAVAARLGGRRIAAVNRRAKYLLFGLDDDTTLMIHLRMTGQLSVDSRDDPRLRFEHLAIELDSGQDLRFADQRKFGRVLHVLPEEITALDRRLGPEPLSDAFSAEALVAALARRSGKLKSVLLDQTLVAGLGNIYVDEALFRAKVHPERVANSLTTTEVRRLHRAIRAVLRESLEHRGTTFSSFQDANGEAGAYGRVLTVYGQGNKGACPRCGRPLAKIVVGGRGTHYCPRCQPLIAPAAE